MHLMGGGTLMIRLKINCNLGGKETMVVVVEDKVVLLLQNVQLVVENVKLYKWEEETGEEEKAWMKGEDMVKFVSASMVVKNKWLWF